VGVHQERSSFVLLLLYTLRLVNCRVLWNFGMTLSEIVPDMDMHNTMIMLRGNLEKGHVEVIVDYLDDIHIQCSPPVFVEREEVPRGSGSIQRDGQE
jgi:hypothetical protein